MIEKAARLQDRVIVVGVTGGIAAYRSIDLVRELRRRGALVYVVMSRAAREFVNPLTFESISGNSVHLDMFNKPAGWSYPHLELAQKADAVVVAPATAHFLSRAAYGMADDLLSAMLLACRAPVFICPAMNPGMYSHPAVQDNTGRARELGYIVMEPESGDVACGDTGPGRLPAIDRIVSEMEQYLFTEEDLKGSKVLVTAGATREHLDPVRFITNRSTGKMGFAVARAALARGAEVTLVTGPLHPDPPPGVEMIVVESAEDMLEEVLKRYSQADIVVKSAAVGDYTPSRKSEQKIKKETDTLVLELEKTPDILYELGKRKDHQVLVGFAAETEDLVKNAVKKLEKKNVDLMVANDVNAPGSGFGTDTNAVKLLFPGGKVKDLPEMKKEELAHIILDNALQINGSR